MIIKVTEIEANAEELRSCRTVADSIVGFLCRVCDEQEKETVDHDGCDGCEYESKQEDEYPCSMCKNNFVDKYEAAEHETD